MLEKLEFYSKHKTFLQSQLGSNKLHLLEKMYFRSILDIFLSICTLNRLKFLDTRCFGFKIKLNKKMANKRKVLCVSNVLHLGRSKYIMKRFHLHQLHLMNCQIPKFQPHKLFRGTQNNKIIKNFFI